MCLLNTTTLEICTFQNEEEVRPYAVLSHTWGDEECTLQDMSTPELKALEGYAKIEHYCEQARKDGLEWAWVDT